MKLQVRGGKAGNFKIDGIKSIKKYNNCVLLTFWHTFKNVNE